VGRTGIEPVTLGLRVGASAFGAVRANWEIPAQRLLSPRSRRFVSAELGGSRCPSVAQAAVGEKRAACLAPASLRLYPCSSTRPSPAAAEGSCSGRRSVRGRHSLLWSASSSAAEAKLTQKSQQA
jgi:hypothetical protein